MPAHTSILDVPIASALQLAEWRLGQVEAILQLYVDSQRVKWRRARQPERHYARLTENQRRAMSSAVAWGHAR